MYVCTLSYYLIKTSHTLVYIYYYYDYYYYYYYYYYYGLAPAGNTQSYYIAGGSEEGRQEITEKYEWKENDEF